MSTGIGAGISPVFELKPGGGVPAGCPKSRYSVRFDGNSGQQYLNNNTTPLAIGGSIGTGSFSISFWLNWSTITTGDEQGVILFGGGNDPKLQIYLNAASQSLLFNANNSAGGGSSYSHGSGNTIFPVIDTWYNFTFVMERTATTINTEWFKVLHYPITQKLGNEWLLSQTSVVLKVPSAIVDREYNYLLNPLHPDFKKIKVLDITAFNFDSRLKMDI